MAKTAAEIIATVLCDDISEVKDGAYQQTRNPTVYVVGRFYYCAPTQRQKLRGPWNWHEVGEAYGRKVYRAD